jgi:hypothetical protein
VKGDWCDVVSFGVVSRYFSEDDKGITVTVATNQYTKTLQNFLAPKL